MGGQIMPPVMGAVAFIMAETLNIPYIEICKAAAIPAVLYFVACFWMVHLEAGRLSCMACRPRNARAHGRGGRGWYLVLPLIDLVWLLLAGYTPLFSGMVGLALTAILLFGMASSSACAAWACASCSGYPRHRVPGFVRLGVDAFFAIIALLVAVALSSSGRSQDAAPVAGRAGGRRPQRPAGRHRLRARSA